MNRGPEYLTNADLFPAILGLEYNEAEYTDNRDNHSQQAKLIVLKFRS